METQSPANLVLLLADCSYFKSQMTTL